MPENKLNKFTSTIETEGYYVLESFLDEKFTQKLKEDSLKWVKHCGQLQVSAGLFSKPDSTAHHAIGGKDSIDALIHQHLFHQFLHEFFHHKPYILHACNPVSGAPKQKNYLHKIHRDTYTYIHTYNFRINVLIALDDFKASNGATEFLPKSHKRDEKPNAEEFEANKRIFEMPKGSVAFFNSYLWHRAGNNLSSENRVALTLSFGPSFVKPQLDYARMIGEEEGKNFSELSRQVLGFNSRVPTNHSEWYQKPEKRLYKPNQG